MSGYRRILGDGLRRLRFRLSVSPAGYGWYSRFRDLRFRLSPHSSVVVDSYPRSANSFFEAAFSLSHSGNEVVAHHSHAAGQVIAGVKRGLPAIVLIRHPIFAVSSYYEMVKGKRSLISCLHEYIVFYEALYPFLDSLIIVRSESINDEFFDLTTMLRDVYGLNIRPYVVTASVRVDIQKEVDRLAIERNGFIEKYSPTHDRLNQIKRKQELEDIRRLLESDSYLRLMKVATKLHSVFVERSFDCNSKAT